MNILQTIYLNLVLGQIEPQNEFLLRSEKIYSVLTILLVIFSLLIIYLFITQRKIRNLEKKMGDIVQKEHNQ